MTHQSSRTAATQAARPKRKAGTKSTMTKTSSAQKSLSTAGTSNGYTTEQLSLFNSMQAKFKAQKKATATAQDEDTLVLFLTRYFDS